MSAFCECWINGKKSGDSFEKVTEKTKRSETSLLFAALAFGCCALDFRRLFLLVCRFIVYIYIYIVFLFLRYQIMKFKRINF